jgi:uncharacterized protein
MLLRFALILLLCVFVARTFWKMVDSLIEGITGGAGRGSRPPLATGHMERDPVCGTFVLPASAVSVVDGRTHVYFCSTRCRDAYRGQRAPGRTA